MQVLKQIINVPQNRELHIQLPENAMTNEEVEVIVLFKTTLESEDEKLAVLQEAMSDPLFLEDLREIEDDFRHVDFEEVSK